MRPRSATGTIIAATFLLASGRAAAQSRPEYDAEIGDDRVYVLAGPGPNYYPTNLLNRDDKVTVYGRPVGDYVQILPPPERSFSWIRGTDVEETEAGDCLVKTDGAGVYVGSEIHREARFVRQVRLPRGAKVKVLDKLMVQESAGPERGQVVPWYKILPPEDEVRYVLASKLRQPNQAVLVPQSPAGGKDAGANAKAVPGGGPDAKSPTSAPARRMFRPDEPIPPATPVSGTKLPEAKPTSSGSDKPKARRPEGANAVELDRLRDDLDRVRDKLPEHWNLPLLEKRFAALRDAAETPDERAAVETLGRQIAQMKSVERRLREIEDRGRQYKQEDQQIAGEIERLLGRGPRSGPRFTAQGTLEPSKLLVDGKKTYQLADAQKRPTHLLVAPPGLNLDKHLRRRVGVIGRPEPRSGVSLPLLRVTQVSLLEE